VDKAMAPEYTVNGFGSLPELIFLLYILKGVTFHGQ
jgi:hypothetical protein